MRRILITLGFIWAGALQAQTLQWGVLVNSGTSDCRMGDALHLTADGGLLLTRTGCGLVVEKYNAQGLRVLQKTLVAASGNKSAAGAYVTNTRAITDAEGNVLVVGAFKGTLDLGTYTLISTAKPSRKGFDAKRELDLFILKLDRNGVIVWARHLYHPRASEAVQDLVLDEKGVAHLYMFWAGGLEIAKTSVELKGKRDQLVAVRFNVRGEYLSYAPVEGIRRKLKGLNVRLYNAGIYCAYLVGGRAKRPVVSRHDVYGKLSWLSASAEKPKDYRRGTKGTLAVGMAVADEEVRLIGAVNKRYKRPDKTEANGPALWMERLAVADGKPFFNKFIDDMGFDRGTLTAAYCHVLADGSGYVLGQVTNAGAPPSLMLFDVRPSTNNLSDCMEMRRVSLLHGDPIVVTPAFEVCVAVQGMGGASLQRGSAAQPLNNPAEGDVLLLKFQD